MKHTVCKWRAGNLEVKKERERETKGQKRRWKKIDLSCGGSSSAKLGGFSTHTNKREVDK